MNIDVFRKKKKYSTLPIKSSKATIEKNRQQTAVKETSQQTLKQGLMKCPSCGDVLLDNDLKSHGMTCHLCHHHFRIDARNRIEMLIDKGSFKELDEAMEAADPLHFPEYPEKIAKAKERAGEKEGLVSGMCRIGGNQAVIAAMEPNFMMGSMGSVVGEKLTRAIEKATSLNQPVIIFAASGGARMQEGVLALMQMAKTSAALSRHAQSGNLFISVLTDPTTGGVTASFAMLGDIILAEPEALIAFAGPRVIEQTIRQTLPEGFQRAEFLLAKGFVDRIVKRTEMRQTLTQILDLHGNAGGAHE